MKNINAVKNTIHLIFVAAGLIMLGACSDSGIATMPEDPVIRVSVDGSGNEGDGQSNYPKTSSDGRYVVFDSEATNLIVGDGNGVGDVYLHDTKTHQTTRLSVDSNGIEGNDISFEASISHDGRYVVFESYASNLVQNDTNASSDVFLRDIELGTTIRVSVSSSGVEADSNSGDASISANGRYIAYASSATNLVSGDTNSSGDIFVYDTQTSLTTRVSVDSSGVEGNWHSTRPTISDDGRYIAFESRANNLVVDDTPNIRENFRDVFLHDRQTGATSRVSIGLLTPTANNNSYSPVITPDGRYISFYSDASDLVVDDTNSSRDVFVYETDTSVIDRISVDSYGIEGDAESTYPTISADGRYVVFISQASNLVTDDSNGAYDVFVRDLQTNTTYRISLNSDGSESIGDSVGVHISADGKYAVFESDAINLVSNDTNNVYDVFRVQNKLR